MSEIPSTSSTAPVTSGGKYFRSLLNGQARARPITPPASMQPQMAGRPSVLPIEIIVATWANAAPPTTGMRAPANLPAPSDWMSVMTPATSRSALTSMATVAWSRPSAAPMVSGTDTQPTYIMSTCWMPKTRLWCQPKFVSTADPSVEKPISTLAVLSVLSVLSVVRPVVSPCAGMVAVMGMLLSR